MRHADELLKEMKIDEVDVVLNCLPTPSLPFEVNRGVFDCINRVGKNALVGQLTVIPLVFKPLYRRLFAEVDFELVMANIPPGGVYFCRGLKPDYLDQLPKKK